MTKPADSEQIAKARALKVVKDLDLTHRGYMGEEYFANELVAFAASERQAVIEDCAPAPQTSAEPTCKFICADGSICVEPKDAHKFGLHMHKFVETSPFISAGDAPPCSCNPKPFNGQHWTGCPEGKVEEIARQIYSAIDRESAKLASPYCTYTPPEQHVVEITLKAITAILRPYFPPASQTPTTPEDVPDLYRLAYMPGVWSCPKCGFVLSKATISTSSASIGTTPEDRQSEECPNDGEWMVPITYKESLRVCEKRLLQKLESRATPASTARTETINQS